MLRTLLNKINSVTGPKWFSIIVDEATDACNTKQLNLSIRWISDDYGIHEDPVGLCCVPDTIAETWLISYLPDVTCHLRCAVGRPDGTAYMQGSRTGVATRILCGQPASLPVHCLAHSLNWWLQNASRKLPIIRDALELCREIYKLFEFSPKRWILFASNLTMAGSEVGLKPLYVTRWTVRSSSNPQIVLCPNQNSGRNPCYNSWWIWLEGSWHFTLFRVTFYNL